MGKSIRLKRAESMQREELADELQRIIKRGKRINDNRSNLRISYEKWDGINLETIKCLMELLDLILNVNTAANAASSVASSAEFLGGIVSFAGAISDKRGLIGIGDDITKGGAIVNVGTFAIKNSYLKQLCTKATENFTKNKEYTDAFEEERCSYFQELEAFKRELRMAKENNTLSMLLETAQQQGFDFLGDIGLDDSTKSMLRTNLRQMCRSNAKKIKATNDMGRTEEIGRYFAGNIRGMLYEFKELLNGDHSLFWIFSEETKKFIGENVDSILPCIDTAESWLGQYSGINLLQGGTALYEISSSICSASRIEVGVASGMRILTNFTDLIMRISDIESGSKSKESEELKERIEEMKEMRENIVTVMRNNFGWHETHY